MKPYPIEVGPEVRLPPIEFGKPIPRHFTVEGRPEEIVWLRGEPDVPKWEGRCKVHFDPLDALARRPHCPLMREDALRELRRGYTGPNQRLGDYFIREFARMGTERRQVVQFLVVGTGRIEQMPRSRFEKLVRPA